MCTPPQSASTDQPDIATMRQTIAELLPEKTATAPQGSDLEVLLLLLRGHVQLLIPDVEQLADRASESMTPFFAQIEAVVARRRLAAQPSAHPESQLWLARRLARSLASLCDSYEFLR
ncbi:DUF6415 family natural product biosynthesis protein [Streptomyces griseoluteus]|uniref:DUF6415 family natural product biosynthesis protein n=1 Tax=Streptomyces griseoluteus TaxID=29306 RepID=UPI00381D91D0